MGTIFRGPFQAHGLPGDAQTAFGFRTDRHEFQIRPQGMGDEMILFVVAVIADVFAQKTGADADFDFFVHFSEFFCRRMETDADARGQP